MGQHRRCGGGSRVNPTTILLQKGQCGGFFSWLVRLRAQERQSLCSHWAKATSTCQAGKAAYMLKVHVCMWRACTRNGAQVWCCMHVCMCRKCC